MRFLPVFVLALLSSPLLAADWEKVTDGLAKKENAGYGGICGVLIEPSTGDILLNISDRGFYRSTDQGNTFTAFAAPFKGRTEWPGCITFDPTGKSKRLVAALVYGSPILIGDRDGGAWNVLEKKSGHVDWCALDWTNPDPKLIITFKHESGGMLIRSTDGGKSFTDIGKGYASAWVFDDKIAVATQAKTKDQPEPKLVRTTDAGTTWTTVADHTTTALPKWRDGKLYWVVEKGLITTTNKGETWTLVSDIKDAKLGPIFGKEPGQLFVLTKNGIIESLDDGKTWGKPIPLPQELKGWSPLTWLDYDPKNDALYVMKMTSELYRLKRN